MPPVSTQARNGRLSRTVSAWSTTTRTAASRRSSIWGTRATATQADRCLAPGPRRPYIIGVHSGDEYKYIPTPFGDIVAENNNVAAGGSGMVNMIRKALADWP